MESVELVVNEKSYSQDTPLVELKELAASLVDDEFDQLTPQAAKRLLTWIHTKEKFGDMKKMSPAVPGFHSIPKKKHAKSLKPLTPLTEPPPAVELMGIAKRYNIYEKPVDRLKEIVYRNRRCFHQEFWALRDFSVTFPKGWTTTLLGPNGSGKSTLLQIIAGTLEPTWGTVHREGRLTAILELGAGFQSEYTGRENAILGGMLLGITEDEMAQYLPSIIEFAEIGDFLDQPVKTYSSGMIVRLAYACATAVNPDILLVDEALAVGDMRFQEKCFRKIDEMQKGGTTVILVTHDLGAASQAHKTVLLNGGKIVCQGWPREVIPVYEQLMDTGEIAPKSFSTPTDFVST